MKEEKNICNGVKETDWWIIPQRVERKVTYFRTPSFYVTDASIKARDFFFLKSHWQNSKFSVKYIWFTDKTT
jgi:hypothetical protein